MGWAMLPKPGERNAQGEEIGPCAGACKHTDCAETRVHATRLCALCGELIGYGVMYYGHKETMRHAKCVWKDLDAGR